MGINGVARFEAVWSKDEYEWDAGGDYDDEHELEHEQNHGVVEEDEEDDGARGLP